MESVIHTRHFLWGGAIRYVCMYVYVEYLLRQVSNYKGSNVKGFIYILFTSYLCKYFQRDIQSKNRLKLSTSAFIHRQSWFFRLELAVRAHLLVVGVSDIKVRELGLGKHSVGLQYIVCYVYLVLRHQEYLFVLQNCGGAPDCVFGRYTYIYRQIDINNAVSSGLVTGIYLQQGQRTVQIYIIQLNK